MSLTQLLPRAFAYRYAIAHALNGVLFVLAFVGNLSPDAAALSALWPFPEQWRAYAVALHGSLAAGIVGAKMFWAKLRPLLPDRDRDGPLLPDRDRDGTPDPLDEAPDDASRPAPPGGAQ